MSSKFFTTDILQRNYRKMTIKWSFSYSSFVKLSLYNMIRVLRHLLFVCFVALRPKSTAMVIAGRSVRLTTLFPGQA